MDLINKKEKIVKIDHKPKRRRLKVEDPDFTPPDGGWGWLIVFACGFSNLSTFPMFQQFGLIFREKFETLGITNTQTTTVINLNSAFNACVGLLNGPVFKTFSYRQVAMFGSCLVATSLLASRFCESFWTYLIFYAMCYGAGIGITQSSNALALNTYFKNRRRIATGLSWSTTALGPIVWPYIITALMEIYGMEGTLLLFSAFAWHAFLCSILLQPVEWHTRFREEGQVPEAKTFLEVPTEKDLEAVPFELSRQRKSRSLLSSQYLCNEDDPRATGYEIIDPGTPMMIKANDGWYSQNRSLVGSRLSLASNKTNKGTSRMPSGQNSLAVSKRASYNNLSEARSKRNSSINLAAEGKEESRRKRKLSQNKASIREEAEDSHEAKPEEKAGVESNKLIEYPNEKDVLKTAAKRLAVYKQETEEHEHIEESNEHMTFLHKLYIFFDFDLFNDPIYVVLMLGITVANFAEINFSILTPMVLKEFQFENYEIATFMSLLGATDILVRFFVPFIAGAIDWENRTFFLIGVLSMAFGRIVLVHTQTYSISLIVAVIIGAGKGLRTIFMALVIPSHVPLERLPAASGLQLATSGLLFLIMGPFVGWVRDMVDNYVITLHILNIMTYITAIAWTVERMISNKKTKN